VARLHAMLQAQREALLAHEAGVRAGVDLESLHQHRVAARRVRAFLRATRPFLDEEWRASLDERLSELGRLTGPVRDLDVLGERLRGDLQTLPSG
jgi:CHAD domain-containing protein